MTYTWAFSFFQAKADKLFIQGESAIEGTRMKPIFYLANLFARTEKSRSSSCSRRIISLTNFKLPSGKFSKPGGGVHTFCMLQLIARSHPDTALIKFRFENSEIVAQLLVFFILVALARVNASYWFTNVRLVLRLKRSFTANFRQ